MPWFPCVFHLPQCLVCGTEVETPEVMVTCAPLFMHPVLPLVGCPCPTVSCSRSLPFVGYSRVAGQVLGASQESSAVFTEIRGSGRAKVVCGDRGRAWKWGSHTVLWHQLYTLCLLFQEHKLNTCVF